MKAMRLAIMTIALAAISAQSYAAMSMTEIRREARFLTDRMGYELGLSNRQYEDVYEINFDFLYHVNEVIDDVVYGYDDAIDYYYYLLDVRNEDLMYVMRNRQYRRFVNRDYFYRPLYMVGNTWGLRIYDRYADRNYYYFNAPVCYHTYVGAHYRIHFTHSYYASLYSHALYHGAFRLWGGGYDHHHYDGWHCRGKHKYEIIGSRPWSNAKNYEKSRNSLKAGYVNVPSRDENNRLVEVNSEENRRTAVTSNTPSRTTSSRSKTTTSTSTKSNRTSVSNGGNRRTNAASGSSVSTNRRDNASRGTGVSGNSTRRSSSTKSSSSSASSARSSSSSKSSSVSSSSRRSSSSSSSSSSSVSSSRSTSSSKSSGSSRSSSSSSSRSSSNSSSRSGSRR